MKEIVARATLKTEHYFNTGFIHIKDNIIEGIFTLDYLTLGIYDKKLIIHLTENKISIPYSHTIEEKIYMCKYSYKDLYIPDEYILYDEYGQPLILCIEDPVYDSKKISEIIDSIESIRF